MSRSGRKTISDKAQMDLIDTAPEDLFNADQRGQTNGKAAKANGSGNGKSASAKANGHNPPNLGKAVRLPVPDFSDPNRPPTCLEVDFPIAPINALANLEGNAGKPIYQMSKWWARRRSSVFRSLLIAAATQAPDDPAEAAKLVWDTYYANHQKAGSFKHLKVLEPFMGGGTTLVEGSRLGFQLTGIDLNPVAWFVCRNELACSDPDAVRALFDHIEAEVKPLVQPFYTTTCPRGHTGRWIEKTKVIHETDADGNDRESVPAAAVMPSDFNPLDLPPDQRKPYEWRGPEVIYTFWAKHGPCQAPGCNHRTPIFKSPVIAIKQIATKYLDLTCPSCGHAFHAELGESRMAPAPAAESDGSDERVHRVILDSEHPFTELSQPFAKLLADYDKGNAQATIDRLNELEQLVDHEPGLHCPACAAFAGKPVKDVLAKHGRASRAGDRKKKDFDIEPKGNSSKKVSLHLLIHPDWLTGAKGVDGDRDQERELGGYAGAPPQDTADWFAARHKTLSLIEVRGETLPDTITLPDGTVVDTAKGNVPAQSVFECQKCGRRNDVAEAERTAGHHSPVSVYALQCHCPQCDAEGYNYNGRYFKAPDQADLEQLGQAEQEWIDRRDNDLAAFWPRSELPYAWETHVQKGNLTRRGYTHWWKLFNPRQLLTHTQLLRCIINAADKDWPLDVREQALGALQQYLRNQNMFCFWNVGADKLEPMFSNPNYHIKAQVLENSVYGALGRGNWIGSSNGCINGSDWQREPWEVFLAPSGSDHVITADPVIADAALIGCGNSAEQPGLDAESFDTVVTDPPFGDNLFYADLSDFFYVWLRIPLLQWYEGMPEAQYFLPEFTPKTTQAIRDPAQHPDDREPWEKDALITRKHLTKIREITGDDDLVENAPNPLYQPEPASDYYQQSLTACWRECHRVLKPGGLLAFTFHHSQDEAWTNVLTSLFDAGFVLVATYPVRSDETKGDSANAAFGSKLIEYDIVHVCRKRLDPPEPVSWAKMRRWVRDEARRLRDLLEASHGKDLPEPDLRVILRGKALEFYSRHYGQVFTGDDQLLSVNEALLGINQLLEDMLASGGAAGTGMLPPEQAEPASRLFLRIFRGRKEMTRDELHKTLKGWGVGSDLEARGWIRIVGKAVHVVPVVERCAFFTARGRRRSILKTDLDQAVFLTGAAMAGMPGATGGGTSVNINTELDSTTWTLKRSVDAILAWMADPQVEPDEQVREGAKMALDLVTHWRSKPKTKKAEEVTLFEQLEAEAVADEANEQESR